jgi:hypothetical protein
MIAIVGDFNDTPDSDPLTPLLSAGSDLRNMLALNSAEERNFLGKTKTSFWKS